MRYTFFLIYQSAQRTQRRLHKRSHGNSHWYIVLYIYAVYTWYINLKREHSRLISQRDDNEMRHIVGWVAFWPSAWLSAWFMCTALVVQKFESESEEGGEREGGIVGHGLSMCPLECSTQLDSCNLLWQTCLLSILTMILPPKHTHTHTNCHLLELVGLCACLILLERLEQAHTYTYTVQRRIREELSHS